ncbi:hypothetical protein OIU77_008765 [Salix suchowensis]|uniref:Reverse transcriptase zinc-binding domain-containing protein n=1 Tax=Salix suchowensis TaxID=1278906 RepID=A0ABQ9AC23_9ROSI|nr:hypothetical protein OIU77_008765 [Salix suchowensis]
MLGFTRKTPPVVYLGVPLLSTKLTRVDCNALLEKLTARIKLWTTATLSYAGRLQLIKSVLFSMQVYWSSMFVLPASVIRSLEGTLAAFLWRGSSMARHGAKVSWNHICYPKQEGGLGVKSIREWNMAATCKHLWRINTATGSIWTDWVKSELLKGNSIWRARVKGPVSWAWRKILESRIWFRGMFKSTIGSGANTSLWFDPWLPDGRSLINSYRARILASTGLPWDAKVDSIIQNGNWSFPAGHPDISAAWGSITFQPRVHRLDRLVWAGHHSGNFNIASAWDFIRRKRQTHPYACITWFPGHIPRHAFILWLAMRGRLATMDRPHVQRKVTVNVCVLCGVQPETHTHLFFQCGYSSALWVHLSTKAGAICPFSQWDDILQWASSNFHHKKNFSHNLACYALSTSVYLTYLQQQAHGSEYDQGGGHEDYKNYDAQP